ncbi:phosphomevalonate kinase-like [Penaeus japonicus]|uniref:phosphomevalonate kinase-like n=1 Tax=Penaeus japonicus TaxID=27405 RepID=UPI001C70BE6B|nr:phosphomevalonate kinase-like [Penaeus japonicus]
MAQNPKLILLFSGKRKSGKDYITDLLQERLGDVAKTIRLSGPIKQQFAANNGLDYSSLLSASEYKEKYRLQMIEWSEAKRAQDSGFFIRAAIEMYEGGKYPLWIVSDMRRRSDLAWFKEQYGARVHTVRITASPEVRGQRGWTFTAGVDDAESECDLDGLTEWDSEVDNSGDSQVVEDFLAKLIGLCASKRSD